MFEPSPNINTVHKIARPYAKAAFEFAQEHNNIAEWEERLSLLATVMKDNTQPLLRDPNIPASEGSKIMDEVMDKLGATSHEKNFINILIENKRLSILPWIYDGFVANRKAAEGITDVTITSAFPLSQKEVETLTASIEKKFNIKAAVPVIEIDRDLIGGVKVKAGDLVWDASIKAKLESLRTQLTK